MLGLSLIALVSWAALTFLVRSNATLLLLGKIGLGVSLLLLAYAIAYAIGLSQPMLLLTPKSLVYRKVRIPWQLITEIKELDTPEGPCVGVVLKEGKVRFAPVKAGAIGATAGPFVQRDLARYGAIAVPPACGVTLEELMATILEYQARVLGGT